MTPGLGRPARCRRPPAVLLAAALAALLAPSGPGAGPRAGPLAPSGPGAGPRAEPLAPEPLASVRAGPLTIHHARGYADVATELVRRGPGDLARVASALGLPPPAHLDVYLLPRRAPVDPSAWGLPLGPRWAAGLALTGRPVVVLRTAEDLGPYGNEVATVLVHELVHAVSSEALGSRYAEVPAWLREGTASYLSFDWHLADAARSVRAALLGGAVPFARLADGFPADAESAQQAYLQSFSFVAWLVERHGPAALPRLYRALAAGESFHPAFRGAFGDSVSELEGRWRTHYLVRYRWVPVLTSTTTLWLGVTGLFLLAAAARRRRSAALVESWSEDAPKPADDAAGPPGAAEASAVPGAPGEEAGSRRAGRSP